MFSVEIRRNHHTTNVTVIESKQCLIFTDSITNQLPVNSSCAREIIFNSITHFTSRFKNLSAHKILIREFNPS
jgi:hypothetical protein